MANKKLFDIFKNIRHINMKIKNRWALSYVIILLLPITMCVATLIKFQDEINDVQAQKISTQLINVMHNVESETMSSRYPYHYFVNSDIINRVMSINSISDTDAAPALNELSAEIERYVKTNSYIGRIYFYIDRLDLIVASDGVYLPYDFYMKFSNANALSYGEWKARVSNKIDRPYYHLYLIDPNEGNLGYGGSLHTYGMQRSESSETLLDMIVQSTNEINSPITFDDTKLVIYDRDGEIIYGIENSKELRLMLDEKERDGVNENYDKRYIVLKQELRATGFTFLIATKKYNAFFSPLSIMYIFIILFLSIVCVWLVWKTVKSHYSVFDNMLLHLKSYRDKTESADEIERINKMITNMVADNIKKTKRLNIQRKQFTMLNINKLLAGDVAKFRNMQSKLPENERIRFLGSRFAVIIIGIEDSKADNKESEIKRLENKEMLRFALDNVVEEVIANFGNMVYPSETDDMLVYLISFRDGMEGLMDKLTEQSEFIKRLFEKEMGTTIAVSVSKIREGLDGIGEAYNEALTVYGYKSVIGSDRIMTPESLNTDTTGRYPFDAKCENRLKHLLSSGNLEQAEKLINSVLSFGGENGRMNIHTYRCLIFDIATSMVKSADEFGIGAEQFDGANIIDALVREKNIEEMKSLIISAAADICGNVSRNSAGTLNRKIKSYIEREYHSQDLSVAAIAEKFGINATYLSNTFKEKTGTGLLEYINGVRVNHAVEFLTQTNMSVKDISEMVGYTNSNTFIRVFKKFKGVTPNDYRRMN